MTDPRPTLLVVEDEPEIRRFLRAAFGVEGYRVVESSGGRRGAIDAGTHKPDLAIIDLGLPDVDGIEVIRRIRKWSPMPIIVPLKITPTGLLLMSVAPPRRPI